MIHGLARQGETVGIVGTTKMRKSLAITNMALCGASGLAWLDTFQMEQGRVLLIDNELHPETSAYRIKTVADAMRLPEAEYADRIDVLNLRGHLKDIYQMGDELFARIDPDAYQYVFLDALYRGTPEGFNENDNAAFTRLFNEIDNYALRLNCVFIVVHHSSKGNQSSKAVTDVGSGAGAQSRAVDCHVVIREHAEEDCVVLEAAARSWPPVEPVVLRWDWPLWTLATELDPGMLKSDRTKQDKAARDREQIDDCRGAIQRALVTHPEHQDTLSKIKERSGRKGKFFDLAIGELIREGQLRECKITRANKQEYDGYQWSLGNSATVTRQPAE